MDYKKKYEEAIKRGLDYIRQTPSTQIVTRQDIFEAIFPEFKESEDERIRKGIIKYLSWIKEKKYLYMPDKIPFDDMVAWLEKQGEQKTIDKIKPGKKYKCIASPRYSTFIVGNIYKPEDKFLCSLMNFCSDCFEPIEDGEQELIKEHDIIDSWQKPTNTAEWSEEDNMHLTNAILAAEKEWGTESCTSKWLKSIKDRIQPQPKQEWNE